MHISLASLVASLCHAIPYLTRDHVVKKLNSSTVKNRHVIFFNANAPGYETVIHSVSVWSEGIRHSQIAYTAFGTCNS